MYYQLELIIFFEGRMIGHVYLDFLQNELRRLMNHLNLRKRKMMWNLNDGAPINYTILIHAHLNNEFLDGWIGRG